MRRSTLSTLNIGNQPRQIREKKASLGARPSTGTSGRPSVSTVRRSSQYGRDSYSTQLLKDPRSLSDKGFQQKMIRYLMEFLTEFDYPSPLSNRVLSAPPMKEFKRIFLFVYKYVNPSAKDIAAIDKKPEEEIPKIFKFMGYPFTISKSYMFSVGSPHTWPSLLGALCWLIELIRFSLTLTDDIEGNILFPNDACGPDGQDGTGHSLDKYYFENLEKTYTAFMKGRDLDDLEDFDNEFYEKTRIKNADHYKEMEQLEAENPELDQELIQLDGPSRLESVVQQQNSLEADKDKFRKYIADLQRHTQKMEENSLQFDEEIKAIRLELEAITQENTHLQETLNRQELSPSDVERLKREKQELVKLLQTLEKHRDQLYQNIWDKEMQYAKIHEETEKNIREYNETARKLKLIPVTAENACGLDFELHFNPLSKQPGMEMKRHFKEAIKNNLVKLRQQICEKTRQIQSQIITEEEALDQVTDMVNERREEAAALEAKLTAFEKEFEWKKEVMSKEYQKVSGECQKQEAKVLNTKQQIQAGAEKKEQQLQETKEWADAKLAEMDKSRSEYEDFLMGACKLVMEHKTLIQNRIAELEKLAALDLEEIQNLEVPGISIPLPDDEQT